MAVVSQAIYLQRAQPRGRTSQPLPPRRVSLFFSSFLRRDALNSTLYSALHYGAFFLELKTNLQNAAAKSDQVRASFPFLSPRRELTVLPSCLSSRSSTGTTSLTTDPSLPSSVSFSSWTQCGRVWEVKWCLSSTRHRPTARQRISRSESSGTVRSWKRASLEWREWI